MGRSGVRLLYVSSGYCVHDQRFLQAFTAAGLDVGHLRFEPGRPLEPYPPPGVSCIAWEGDRRPLASVFDYGARALDMRRVLQKVKPDVVLVGPVHTAAPLVALAG